MFGMVPAWLSWELMGTAVIIEVSPSGWWEPAHPFISLASLLSSVGWTILSSRLAAASAVWIWELVVCPRLRPLDPSVVVVKRRFSELWFWLSWKSHQRTAIEVSLRVIMLILCLLIWKIHRIGHLGSISAFIELFLIYLVAIIDFFSLELDILFSCLKT